MIIEALLNLIMLLLKGVFALLPDLPQLPDTLIGYVNTALDYVFNNVGLLNFFISVDMIKILVPLLLLVINFEHIYDFIMWVIKKLPFSID